MKPAFANLEIDLWVHCGKLGFTEPSLCLHHDSLDSGSPILNALNELTGEKCPAQRKLTVAACSRERAMSNLRLMVVPKREDLRVMSVRHDSDTATIEMTGAGLRLLIEAFTSWLNGAEDFGISPRHSSMKPKAFGKLDRESGELWFWGPSLAGP
ncbi:hypothetical protein [Allorhodopirellula heiligendammensis]|uniref:Uncharacterized protein n=1 Tax=Allorhodopirellula heiligendammensis TaxID=2714739 RepID=A0A5C6C3G1_9BACT|nr:hypothetical protein [Allorhodopirellula heiligendammensis]TWU18557.1 hypothetical protein Poly21_07210 [Allorhodopirellula heiligendammensis]